jgi:hypothetical protein
MPFNIKLHEGQAQKQVDDTLRSYSAHVHVNFLVWNHFLGLQETYIGLGTIINMQLTPQAIYFQVTKQLPYTLDLLSTLVFSFLDFLLYVLLGCMFMYFYMVFCLKIVCPC